MIVLLVLGFSILLFRGIGALGVDALISLQASVRFGLAGMLFFTASAHFTSMRKDLVRMVPKKVPYPEAMVYFTGVCEILGAIGLLLPSFQKIAAVALILLLIALLPANIHASRAGITLRGKPPTSLWLRIPMQALFIVLIWWSAISE
ncbi:DoxX family protein [bacterium]|nr:DoxX family protein [bacterium]